MNDAARDWMQLDLAYERSLALASSVGQRDDRVAPAVMEQLFEGVGVDGDVFGHVAVPVDDRRDLPVRAQRVRAGRAEPARAARWKA